ncbi:hypothetical protein ACP6M9_14040, partial [Corynebacterium striatum]
FIEGHSITFELFGVPRHGGSLPFFPARLSWISGVHQKGVRSLRSFVRNAVSLAHSIKHAPNSSRREAGIIADSVIMLVNIFRRMFESV